MKILVIGAAGFLGKELTRDFSVNSEVLGADKYENIKGLEYLDLAKKGLVKEIFLKVKPEIVLLPASVTGVDFCEKNQDLAWRVNTEGPKEVALACKKQGGFLIFYSSDYIFDGNSGPYTEDARPNPLNFYGKTKLEAEKIIQKELRRFLVIRTCSIYGYEKSGLNFAMQVLGALKASRTVQAVNDQFGTPTYVENLSNITFKLVQDRKEGIFNVVGPDYVNRVQFSNEVAKIFGLNASLIRELSTEELKQVAPRPRKGGLKTDKLKKETGYAAISLKEGLAGMKEKLIRAEKGL